MTATTKSYAFHFKRTLSLAWPIVLGQVGHVLTTFADTIMVGHLKPDGEVYLAAIRPTNDIFAVIMVLGMGIAFGVTPIVSSAHGERNFNKLRNVFTSGGVAVFGASILLVLIMLLGAPLLGLLGLPNDVVLIGMPYFKIITVSLIPLMLFMFLKQFMEGLSATVVAMCISLGGNVLNVGLNALLIYGLWGFPELKLDGAGYATIIARIAMVIAMFIYVLRTKRFKELQLEISARTIEWSAIKDVLRLGIPIGFQYTFEVTTFAFAGIMIGWTGTIPLAAHGIALTMATLTYMMASGLSAATSVKVGNQFGQRNYRELKRGGMVGLGMTFLFMFVAAAVLFFGRYVIPPLFSSSTDVAIYEMAAGLLVMAALFQFSDGLQVTAMGILRGMSDVKIPTIISLCSYWGIGIPFGYFVGIRLGYGAQAVWLGLLIGLSVAAILLIARFINLHRKLSSVE